MRHVNAISALVAAAAISGCAPLMFGAGAGAAATGYEAKNKHDLDKLKKQEKSGQINNDEYLRQRDEIEDRSLVY